MSTLGRHPAAPRNVLIICVWYPRVKVTEMPQEEAWAVKSGIHPRVQVLGVRDAAHVHGAAAQTSG